MAPATASINLAAWFFFLPLSFLSNHVGAAPPPISFSFDFSNTSSYSLDDLQFEGDAALNGNLVDLTCNPVKENCIGRMSYKRPVFLYDNNTGELASFTTSFKFAIHLGPTTTKGYGMTFFLSGYPSRLPPGSSGDLLGLTSDNYVIPSGADRFLAVEFDTYSSSSKRTGTQFTADHIGIDLNSIMSVSKTRLPAGYSLSGNMTATITLDNVTRTLEATLHFDDNHSLADAQVKTQLPDDLHAFLPHEVAVGFSAATGAYAELHQIHSWSFNSTMVAGGASNIQPEQEQVLDTKDHHGRVLISVGAVILVLALMLAIWSIMSWYRLKRTRDSFGKGSRLRRFEYRDLSIATDRFSNTNKIGEGGFGVVYSGSLKKELVAVKKILKDSRGEFKDFLAELGTIGRTGHGNVVRLEGWCCNISNFMFWCLHPQKVRLFLVYELVPNGNLHQHLHPEELLETQEVLSWDKRYKIVKGLCSALHYLHEECNPFILHRDIKPQNILLDNDFNAKLGDFGLSRVAQHCAATSVHTAISVGSPDYMDPLCRKNGDVMLHRSSDVYSFGIVLLEIAHGENKLEEVRKLHREQPETFVNAIADTKLAGHFVKKQMERVIVLGLRCSETDENQRPSIKSAMQFLEKGGDLPPATFHEAEPCTASIALA